MGDDVKTRIDEAVAKRRAELEAMSLQEVGQDFRLTFGIWPDLTSGKDNLIARVLAKFSAELQRRA